jgi:signal transduction histidine kinase/CheY-like chemotaxis protein
MHERRETVMRAMQSLRDSWARARDWDHQLGATRAALAEAHSRFGEFYDFVPTPFLVLDEDLRVSRINAAGTAFLDGTTRYRGQPLVAFVAPPDVQRLVGALRAAVPGEQKRLEVRLRSSGAWVPAQLTAKVSDRGDASDRVYYVAILDLSEIRRLEEERRRSADAEQAALAAARAKDEFIAMLSHELRTPLTPILAAADALREEELGGAAREAVAIIRRNVRTEARLVDDLLDVARVTQKRLTVQTQTLSLHRLIDVVLADWAPEATRAGIDVSLELGATRDSVTADSGRIAQVLRNVLANALKFTDAAGRIRVRTDDAEGFVRVSVADTGRGMTAAEIARLFEPFAEAREQFGSRAGLGLGLVISHGIVEAHGGRIRVRSPGRGLGTTVEIELRTTAEVGVPAREKVALPPPRSEGATAEGGEAGDEPAEAPAKEAAPGRRILLVEDHPDSAETLALLLSTKGYEVTVARTVVDARRLAEGCHVMVSDISLPDGSGLDLVQEVRRRLPIHAIALSGYGTEEDQRRSLDAGFAEHLTKPVDVGHLLAAVQRLVGPPVLARR